MKKIDFVSDFDVQSLQSVQCAMCMSMQYYNSIPSTFHQATNEISIHFFYREIVQFIWCNANGYFYENTKRNKYDRKKEIAFFTSKTSPVFGIFLFTLLERKKWKFICLKKKVRQRSDAMNNMGQLFSR